MTRIEVLIGCWGAPPKSYPEDIPRCDYCYGDTSGSVFVNLPEAIYNAVMLGSMSVDQLIEEGYLPPVEPCKDTAAKRYYTSTTIGG